MRTERVLLLKLTPSTPRTSKLMLRTIACPAVVPLLVIVPWAASQSPGQSTPGLSVDTKTASVGRYCDEYSPPPLTKIPPGDPTKMEVSFPAGGGWQGTLVLDNEGVGVWTVGIHQVFRAYACPEIVGLDDRGRCHVLWGYSGKWNPVTTVSDGKWLGGLAQGDVDARIPGPELYVGSQKGNIYQVIGYPDRIADNRRVAHLDGHEIHTLIAGEIDPTSEGPELIAFTLPGAIYRLKPKPSEQDGFDTELLLEMDGRVRQAAQLPRRPGHPPEIAVIMRTGVLAVLTFGTRGPEFEAVQQLPMGMGRLSVKHDAAPERPVVFGTVDDGRVYRHERGGEGQWSSELIYAGPQGMRGCAYGRFDADPEVETVAVFGYSGRVELLSCRDGLWSSEVLFVDRDKGHWLVAGELDGRNATDELVSSGYSARVVMLARPPGYGLTDVLSVELSRKEPVNDRVEAP